MTATTSQKLADALRAAGFEDLAKRAEADEFHDYLSPHDMPETVLDKELLSLIENARTPREKGAAIRIRGRHLGGEFDANLEESDEWAKSPEGQDALGRLVKAVPQDTDHKHVLQGLARALDEILNGNVKPKRIGFAVLIFNFDSIEKDYMNWVSNAERKDMIVALKEMIAQLEGRMGEPGHG